MSHKGCRCHRAATSWHVLIKASAVLLALVQVVEATYHSELFMDSIRHAFVVHSVKLVGKDADLAALSREAIWEQCTEVRSRWNANAHPTGTSMLDAPALEGQQHCTLLLHTMQLTSLLSGTGNSQRPILSHRAHYLPPLCDDAMVCIQQFWQAYSHLPVESHCWSTRT